MLENQKTDIRIAFVGAVEEGRECLQEIINYGGNVVGIFTFTEEIALKTSGAVDFEEISIEHNIPLFRVKSTNNPAAVAQMRELKPDIIFVIGWTRLVSAEILEIPRFGCIGMHASLLPRFRGRAPVNWVIIHNEKETGNTAMQLNEGVDTGKMVAQKGFPISMADTCQTVYHKVARAGREMIVEILDAVNAGNLPSIQQNDAEATEMPKRRPEDGIVDWQKGALDLFNFVRALTHPYPGAFSYLRGRKLFIWEARIAHYPHLKSHISNWENIVPGTVLGVSDGIVVMTGNMELLTLHRLSFDEEEELAWRDFVKTYKIQVGDVLESEIEVTVQV